MPRSTVIIVDPIAYGASLRFVIWSCASAVSYSSILLSVRMRVTSSSTEFIAARSVSDLVWCSRNFWTASFLYGSLTSSPSCVVNSSFFSSSESVSVAFSYWLYWAGRDGIRALWYAGMPNTILALRTLATSPVPSCTGLRLPYIPYLSNGFSTGVGLYALTMIWGVAHGFYCLRRYARWSTSMQKSQIFSGRQSMARSR